MARATLEQWTEYYERMDRGARRRDKFAPARLRQIVARRKRWFAGSILLLLVLLLSFYSILAT